MSPDKPRFRRDLEATPAEADGQKFVDVRDPTTGGTFRFYDFEYRVALAFDGLPYDRVIPWLRLSAGLDYQEAQLREFSAYLHQMGLLESSPTGLRFAPAEPEPAAAPDDEPDSLDEWEEQYQAATVAIPAPPEVAAPPAEDAAAPTAALAEDAVPATTPTEAEEPAPPAVAVMPTPTLSLEEVPTVPVRVESVLAEAVAEVASLEAPDAPAPPSETDQKAEEPPASAAPPPDSELAGAPTTLAAPTEGLQEEAPAPDEVAAVPALIEGADGLPEASGELAPSLAEAPAEMGALPVEEAAPSPSQVVHEAVIAAEEVGALPAEEAAPSPSQVVQEAVVASEAVPDEPGAAETQDGYAPAAAETTPTGHAAATPASSETLDGFAPASEEMAAAPAPTAQQSFTEIVLDGVTPPVEEVPRLPPKAHPEPASAESSLGPAALIAGDGAAMAEADAPPVAVEPAAEAGAEHARSEASPNLAAAAVAPDDPMGTAMATLGSAEAPPSAARPITAFALEPAATAAPAPEAAQDAPTAPGATSSAQSTAPSASALAAQAPSLDEARHLDSMAFPVLPTPPPESVGHFPPRRSSSAAWPALSSMRTPVPVTPPPITVGPLRAAQQVAERRHQRRSLLLFGSLGVIAAVALLAVLVPLFFPAHSTPRTEVSTAIAAPGTVLHYFAGSGAIAAMPGTVLRFPASGVVIRIAKTDSTVAVGDVVAAVEAARPLLNQLTHLRERLAFYQQIAETMHQVGNTAEEEKNTANVEVRKAKVAKTLRALADVAVIATAAGEVEEAFAREGDKVEAGGLALRMRSAGHRAVFDLPRPQAAEARHLGFCQIGVEGFVLDCRQAADDEDETHVSVDIAALPAALLGRPARLARARFDNAVALPASAVQSAGRRHQVLVVSPFGRLEARPVTVAEQNAAEAVVIQGLDSGERVVLEPTSDLRPGMQVTVRP